MQVHVIIIDKASSEVTLREREAQWVYRLKCFSLLGLNVDDFFCARQISSYFDDQVSISRYSFGITNEDYRCLNVSC